ncbi:uroporphyrin-iii c-methyltransferase signature 1 [Lucifera butyrica]|uniref:Uroporphyrin-iii c-methyltransferase signature 1 n=1 Tax=Lucifera butyrica TaxID=1351585 RepID=A0A498R6L1_9FIRM|nr:precorrin-4 C(11)-methyltransferase [Lucifera butyrica]VBB06839.1 uroporphyrin-iii c-methyltransferase signature 1 [Lucifera butyrica]
MHVYFVGAGPGDPELITLKGQRLLTEADTVIYAGSLVNPALLQFVRADAAVYNSATMTLEEVIAVIEAAVAKGKKVVRLHTGDPSIYGAIQEQMDALEQKNIPYTVVPGVSSFLAVAAALRQEYTLPDVSQTVIITRMEGRTPVPAKEKLALLASHNATMCIFLSIHMLDDVIRELMEGGYPPDTPVAVVQKASWPDEKIIRSRLDAVAGQVAAASIDRTAMIVVGKCLDSNYALSRLYAADFGHMFREAK